MSAAEPGSQGSSSADNANAVADNGGTLAAGGNFVGAAATPIAESEPSLTGRALRAGFWQNVIGSFDHINRAVKAEGKRLRVSDYVSVILLPVAAILLAWASSSYEGLTFRPYIVLLFNFIALYFIASRIGIIRTLTYRQTHLVWVIICASFLLGCVFSLLIFDFMKTLE